MLHNRRFIFPILCLFLAACPQAPPRPPAAVPPPSGPGAAGLVVPQGFRVEVAARGLDRPVAMVFDEAGRLHVVEGGGEGRAPRLLRIDPGGIPVEIIRGEAGTVWTGVAEADGLFFVTEGGPGEDGRLLRLDGAEIDVLAADFPNGDHGTANPAIGPDGWLYFTQGSATNAGVVGPDNSWLARNPRRHDIPCQDVALTGALFTADDKRTGAFARFGADAGTSVAGAIPCSGAVLRIPPMGGDAQLVAWGLRDPGALAFAADGRLFAADRGVEARGSRPTAPGQDLLWEITPGVWYGWPDFNGQTPVYGAGQPPLLSASPNPPPRPLASLGEKAGPAGLDLAGSGDFGGKDQAYLALAMSVVRVDVATGALSDFVKPKDKAGGGSFRPSALRFDRDGAALYVADAGAGMVWRIGRQ